MQKGHKYPVTGKFCYFNPLVPENRTNNAFNFRTLFDFDLQRQIRIKLA